MIIGYLVICKSTAQLLTFGYEPKHGTLAHGGAVGTVFNNRLAAARAIQRTVRYAQGKES